MALSPTTLILLIFSSAVCRAGVVKDLGGKWTVSGKSNTGNTISVPATVPGGIYSDLMDNNIIGDIFYGSGDEETKWVSLTDWTYKTTFKVDESLLKNENINIVFEGLDTFAAVIINGETVGKGENMFVRYIFDVKDVLRVGDNTLNVVFSSAVNVADELARLQNLNYEVPPNCPAAEYRGACHANQIRKMQASFSWDWGPSFPSVGIWKEVYLEAYNTAVLRYVVAYPIEVPDKQVFKLNVDVYFSNEQRGSNSGSLTVSVDKERGTQEETFNVNPVKNNVGEVVQTVVLEIPFSDVKRWFPNGYGEAKLYNLKVTFTNNNEIDSQSLRVGFRKVELVQDKLTTGLTFYFRVNGIPIFAKGSNEIPLNILPEKGQDKNTVRRILQAAKDVNMNMLRVWGGGVYESDYFYDTADEFGILIWQDFMFACAMYPTRADYLNNVVNEVRHQVKRLYSHPSIALWAGNNENEVALVTNWYGTQSRNELYKADYVKLYVDTIKKEVLRLVNSALYITSSPTNGIESEQEGYLASNPTDVRYGDVHYYNYAGNVFDTTQYPTPRFSSEYGFQSLPVVDTWLTATNNSADLLPSGRFVDHRQHHPNGLRENTNLISNQINLPAESSRNYALTYIYYSQIIQAMAVKIETEHYRSYAQRLGPNSVGYTMGALYWQLNDVWVAPTWSGIDFAGRWKMLHYFARFFFAPLLITGQNNGRGQLEVFAVSDVEPLEAVAVVHVFGWHTVGKKISETRIPIKLEPGKAVLVSTIDIDPTLAGNDCGQGNEARTRCFFHFHVQDDAGNNIAPTNFFLPNKIKESNILPSTVVIESVKATANPRVFTITVATDAVALFVWLDAPGIEGNFSDNGFLLHYLTKDITFTAENSISAENLKAALTVTHFKDPIYA